MSPHVFDKFSLRGKVALVTGGSRGLGRAMAQALGEAGARVAVTARGIDAARQAADELCAQGIGAVAVQADITVGADVDRLVEQVTTQLGPIDVLVNNAGIMPMGAFLDEREELMRRQLAINVEGVLLGCRAVLPGMLARKQGHVINIASQAGKIGLAGLATYHATKWAVVGLSHSLDDEYRNTPIAVSCVLPGIVDTELSSGMKASQLAPRIPPAAIAQAIVETVGRPRREVWVPASGRVSMTLFRTLPARARARVLRVLGLEDTNLHVDPRARADYEERVAERVAERI